MVPEKFERDLNLVLTKLCKNLNSIAKKKLGDLKNELVSLYLKNLVKINHSVMELVCAKYLILAGYDVDVERFLDGVSCDIYAMKGLGSLIVEIETGFVPPEHALDPLTYCKARIASKITRYSNHSGKFGLAGPPHYIIQVPKSLIKPPRRRTEEDIATVKMLCDSYYTHPPVSVEEIRNARLHAIYTIDVDKAEVNETDPPNYVKKSMQWAL